MKPYADLAAPMLVKEVRQDLRTRGFTGVFVWYHAALILSIVVMLAAQGNTTGASKEEGALFWFVVALPAIALIPLRGLLAFNKETKANALELLFLTRLTAWQVVFGKWASLTSQAVLFLIAALPYAFLRFFLGNVSITESLLVFAGLLVGAMLASATTVAISALGSAKRERIAGFFVGLIVFGPPIMLVSGSFLYYSFGRAVSVLSGLTLLTVYGVIGVLVMLEVGAWRIAPPSENHALRLRMIGLVLIGVTAMLCLISDEVTPGALGCAAALLLPICLTSLCEAPRFVLGLYDPFVNGSRWWSHVRWLFYPGWVSGVLYVVTSTTLFCLMVRVAAGSESWQIIHIAVLALGIVLAPFAIVLALKRNLESLFRAYAISQLVVVIVTLFLLILRAAVQVDGLVILLKLIPHSAIFFVLDRPRSFSEPGEALLSATVVVVGSLLLLGLRVRPIVEQTLAAEQAARARKQEVHAD